jgi:GNAT superfamily N-acetyltransferase
VNRFLFALVFLIPFANHTTNNADAAYEIRLLTGDVIREMLPFVATQRIGMYHTYPYLYEGSLAFELSDLDEFSRLPQSAIAVAYFDGEPVGFIVGAPLAGYDQHFMGSIEAFENDGKDPKDYYYFADVLILPAHQGKSLATQLFKAFEAYCKNIGFSYACFVSEYYAEHPLKPSDYREVDLIWQHYGYQKSNIKIYVSWNTIQPVGPARQQLHELPYWIKKLN